MILVTGSLICVAVVLFTYKVNLTTIWTSLSSLFLVGISKTSTRLGKTLEKTYTQTNNGFMGQGRFFTNSKEVRRAVEEGIETRAEWEKEKQEINKNKVRGVIIWDIKAEMPVALARVAELANVEKKETEGLLEEIVNATPSLGEYHKKEQVFIKKSTDNISGTIMIKEEPAKSSEVADTKQVIEWEGKISKGGGNGTGYITLPAHFVGSLDHGQYYDLTLVDSNLKTHVLAARFRVTKKSRGFYIPKELCEKHSLIGETVKCYIYQMEHFPVLINEDKIVGLAQSIVEEYKLRKDDLWEVELLTTRGIFREVVLIGMIDRSNRSSGDEYRFTLRLSDVPRSIEARAKFVRKIEKLPSKQKKEANCENYYLPQLFHDGIMGQVHENEMIIFLGNHVPVFTPIQINLLDFIHYFGCYYADGTKKGWAWRINASTPEQADYYIKKYNQLVFGNSLVFELTYTMKPSNRRSDRKVKKNLIQFWKEKSNIDIEEKRIWVRTSKSKNIRKWNVCGSLGIRDDRNLVMEIHVRVMMFILNYLANECLKDDEVWDFLFGILEGDGFVGGGKARFSVGFATHSSDKIIEKLLTRLGIQHRTDKSRVKNNVPAGISVQFGLFEILLNLKRMCDSLFVYYPKRRWIFIERLLKQSTVEYLLKRKETLSFFAKSFILTNMLDDDEIRQLLVNLESELNNKCA